MRALNRSSTVKSRVTQQPIYILLGNDPTKLEYVKEVVRWGREPFSDKVQHLSKTGGDIPLTVLLSILQQRQLQTISLMNCGIDKPTLKALEGM
jgi:hypothetical protein